MAHVPNTAFCPSCRRRFSLCERNPVCALAPVLAERFDVLSEDQWRGWLSRGARAVRNALESPVATLRVIVRELVPVIVPINDIQTHDELIGLL